MKKLILAFISIFFLGLLIGYIPTLASPSPAKPNPGHTASEIGGDTDAERTFNSTGKYTFLGNLDVRGGLTVAGTVSASTFKTRNQACPSGWTCEVNTWDIAAQSIRAYGHVIADGLGSFANIVANNANFTGNVRISGNVGIGTDPGSRRLNINGDMEVTGWIYSNVVVADIIDYKGDGYLPKCYTYNLYAGYGQPETMKIPANVFGRGSPSSALISLFYPRSGESSMGVTIRVGGTPTSSWVSKYIKGSSVYSTSGNDGDSTASIIIQTDNGWCTLYDDYSGVDTSNGYYVLRILAYQYGHDCWLYVCGIS
jgi:hypothetical protein